MMHTQDGKALCLGCGNKSKDGFGSIVHKMWCSLRGTKKVDHRGR